jgi:hypothetical protein
MKSYGVDLIAMERERQIKKEGWTPEHDNAHTGFQLTLAAIAYAAAAVGTEVKAKLYNLCFHKPKAPKWTDPWPWDTAFDKRKKHNRKKCLVVAGALIAAELDRLEREEARER